MRNARLLSLLLLLTMAFPALPAQTDGGVMPSDGGGSNVLESIYVPNLPNAPFSLTLHTEWIHPLSNGGTYTVTNNRSIVRDSAGRIYQERWLLMPKNSGEAAQMTAIQIDDPVAGLFYTCMVFNKTCRITSSYRGLAHYQPEKMKSGRLANGKGSFLHEDLGSQSVAGLLCHGFRDTVTIDPGIYGNDTPMATAREFFYSPELGFNLSSTLDSAQLGRQVFTVTDLNTNEPESKRFQPPDGYKLMDQRKSPQPMAGGATTPSSTP